MMGMHAAAATGLVDLLGFVVELPEGTESFFTAAVFMLQVGQSSSGQHQVPNLCSWQ